MNKRLEKAFEQVAEETIRSAEKIDCGFDEFVEGLDIIAAELRERLNFAKEEMACMEKEDRKDR